MKNMTKIIVAILLISSIGYAVYFGYSYLKKNELDEIYPLVEESFSSSVKVAKKSAVIAKAILEEEGIDVTDKNSGTGKIRRVTDKILSFVHREVKYKTDGDYPGLRPIKRTLIEKLGDCEDQAVLIASLLKAAGVETFLI